MASYMHSTKGVSMYTTVFSKCRETLVYLA